MPASRTSEVVSLLTQTLLNAGYVLVVEPLRPDPVVPVARDGLAGMRLCPIERAILRVLLDCHPRRHTLTTLIREVEAMLGEHVADGVMRHRLSRMTNPDVGMLDNVRHLGEGGYQITRDFLAELSLRSSMCA